jgi:hypothetical protein
MQSRHFSKEGIAYTLCYTLPFFVFSALFLKQKIYFILFIIRRCLVRLQGGPPINSKS